MTGTTGTQTDLKKVAGGDRRSDDDGYPELELKLGRFMAGRSRAKRVELTLATARQVEEGDRSRRNPRARGTCYIGLATLLRPSNRPDVDVAHLDALPYRSLKILLYVWAAWAAVGAAAVLCWAAGEGKAQVRRGKSPFSFPSSF